VLKVQKATHTIAEIANLPDELLLRIFALIDVDELLAVSRVSHHFRSVALDRLLHAQRKRAASFALSSFLLHRPRLQALQPPASSIYLTRTHVAARRLGFSLALVSLNRSLSRRPPLSTLVNRNVVPKDCCRRDKSGEMHIVTGGIVERKRKVEREKVKEGLRVWLERKAGVINRRRDAGVGILVWRFSKRAKASIQDLGKQSRNIPGQWERPEAGRVRVLKGFWEDLGDGIDTLRTNDRSIL